MITPPNSTAFVRMLMEEGHGATDAAWCTVLEYCIQEGLSLEYMPERNTAIQEVITFIQELIDFKNKTLQKELNP